MSGFTFTFVYEYVHSVFLMYLNMNSNMSILKMCFKNLFRKYHRIYPQLIEEFHYNMCVYLQNTKKCIITQNIVEKIKFIKNYSLGK